MSGKMEIRWREVRTEKGTTLRAMKKTLIGYFFCWFFPFLKPRQWDWIWTDFSDLSNRKYKVLDLMNYHARQLEEYSAMLAEAEAVLKTELNGLKKHTGCTAGYSHPFIINYNEVLECTGILEFPGEEWKGIVGKLARGKQGKAEEKLNNRLASMGMLDKKSAETRVIVPEDYKGIPSVHELAKDKGGTYAEFTRSEKSQNNSQGKSRKRQQGETPEQHRERLDIMDGKLQ